MHAAPLLQGWKTEPRKTAYFGTEPYSYSGRVLPATAQEGFPPAIKLALTWARSFFCERFNSVLVNYYEESTDQIGWHSDKMDVLVPGSRIGSLSLGTPTTFFLRRTADHSDVTEIELPHGTALEMDAALQEAAQHCVKAGCAGRINLTFRRVDSRANIERRRRARRDANREARRAAKLAKRAAAAAAPAPAPAAAPEPVAAPAPEPLVIDLTSDDESEPPAAAAPDESDDPFQKPRPPRSSYTSKAFLQPPEDPETDPETESDDEDEPLAKKRRVVVLTSAVP